MTPIFACYALMIDNDECASIELFPTEEARDDFMWEYAFNNSGTETDTLADFKAECDNDLADAMEATNDGWKTENMVREIPANPVDAAREAVAALRYARDCLYVADAPRSLARVKDAISSALGAVRHAEGKAVRS